MRAVLLSLTLLVGCSPRLAEHWVLICDRSPEDGACGPELISEFGAAWSEAASLAPGSTLDLVFVGGSYADTLVVSLEPSPHVFPRPAVKSRAKWRTGMVAELTGVQLPIRDSAKPRSDIVSAMLIAGDLATSNASTVPGNVKLVMATDGLFIGCGFNTERDGFPTVEHLLERLRAEQGFATWSLGMFDKVDICGFGNRGVDAKVAAARRAFYSELLAALGAQAPDIRADCGGMYAEVPDTLRPAKKNDDDGLESRS